MNLNAESLKYRDDYGNTIFHHILRYNENLDYIKKCLGFAINNRILSEKNNIGCTILHHLFYISKDVEIIKYVFGFVKKHILNLFLEKDDLGHTFFIYFLLYNYNLEFSIKYVFGFVKNNFPDLFLQKDIESKCFLDYFSVNEKEDSIKYILSFVKNNFPEILSNKVLTQRSEREIQADKVYKSSICSLILPLTFQIQN